MNDDGSPKLISNDLLPTMVNSQMISNPNLLDNPDFKINQRGLSEYNTDTAQVDVSVDRWLVGTSGTTEGHGAVYNVQERTLTCATYDTGGYYANLQQYIENPKRFAGMQMTLSACISESVGYTLIQIWRTEGTKTTGVVNTPYSMDTMKQLTFTMPADLTEDSKIRVVLQTRGTSVFEWAKLELGPVATPFVPPNPATELAKCQRYFYNSNRKIVFCARSGMVPYQNYYSLPVTMRANPTITVYDAVGTAGYASLRSDDSVKVAISTACYNGRDFNFWALNSDMTANSEYYMTFIANADI